MLEQENPKDLFRPWGFQPGHQIEWAKLLLILRHNLIKYEEYDQETKWMVESAKSLFFRAYDLAWDKTCKADVKYSIIIDLQPCNSYLQ